MIRAFKQSILRQLILRSLMLTLFLLLTACGQDQSTGPAEVKWDRDACDRCQMMLSERNFAAQIRVFPAGKRSKVYKFDDMGCAVLWLNDQNKKQQTFKSDEKTEIWVTDFNTKTWINAQSAWFTKGDITPMGYGLSAQLNKSDGAINYQQAVKHINQVEQKYNIHGGNLAH
jgi:nitrous oxide reductase accessory protein NosL